MGSSGFTIEPPDTQAAGGFTIEPPPEQAAQPSTYQRLTASYNPGVEAYAQQHPIFGPVVRFLDAAGGAAMATPGSVAQMIMHPSTSASGIMDSIKAWADPNVRKAALSVLPEALGQVAGQTATGEALGAATGAAAGAVPGVSDLRAAARDALTKESGALKPLPYAGAKIAGATLGRLTGVPYGELIGAETGPAALRGILGERPIPELGSPENPGWAVKLPGRIPASERTVTSVPTSGTATNPDIVIAPEPNPTPSGVREGSAFSVPREQLPGLIQQGSAGAGEAFRSAGGNIIYAPRGAGIEAPDISALRERMSPAAQEAFGPQLRTDQFNPDTYQVSVHQGGLQHGHVMYTIGDDGTATVNSSLITDEMQGKHLGVAMYKQAIENARVAGASSFQSGDAPEPGAVHAWESLRKSYPVEKVGSGYRIDLTEQPALAGK